MTPQARVSHQMPGRLRLRVPELRRHTPYFQAAERILGECEGVRRVETNALTAGILVFHRNSVSDIAEYAKARNLFDLILEPDPGPPSVRVAGHVERLDHIITAFTQGRVDTRTWAFAGLTAAAVYQMLRGNTLPAGITLVHYALDALPASRSKIEDGR